MSRSYRKNIPGTDWVRLPMCCTKHGSIHEWKRDYNRYIRRRTRNLIKCLDFGDEECDENFEFPEKPALTYYGNIWNSPMDGYSYWTTEDFIKYWKPWAKNRK